MKISPNPEFDFTLMEVGGFDDIPTKQDKFVPLKTTSALVEYTNGSTEILNKELYTLKENKIQGQKDFEAKTRALVQANTDASHPYF